MNHLIIGLDGSETLIPYSKEEIAEVEKARKLADKENSIIEAEAKIKENAKAALLKRIGITAEEAALLLG